MGSKLLPSAKAFNESFNEPLFQLARKEIYSKLNELTKSAPIDNAIALAVFKMHIASFQKKTQNNNIISLANAFLNVYRPIFLDLFNNILSKLLSNHENSSFKKNMSEAFKNLTIIISKINTQDKGTAILLGLLNLLEYRNIENFIQDLKVIVNVKNISESADYDEEVQDLIQTLAEESKPISLSSNSASFHNSKQPTDDTNNVSQEDTRERVNSFPVVGGKGH